MILLRDMVAADAGEVARLIRGAFAAQSVVTDPPPSALLVTEADIATHLREGGGAVVEGEGALVGSALWLPRGGALYFARLAVAPDWRGRGIASRLIAAAEAAARVAHLSRIELSTRLVLADNRRLFAACGFVETSVGAHPGYAAPTFVNMEKWLRQ